MTGMEYLTKKINKKNKAPSVSGNIIILKIENKSRKKRGLVKQK